PVDAPLDKLQATAAAAPSVAPAASTRRRLSTESVPEGPTRSVSKRRSVMAMHLPESLPTHCFAADEVGADVVAAGAAYGQMAGVDHQIERAVPHEQRQPGDLVQPRRFEQRHGNIQRGAATDAVA